MAIRNGIRTLLVAFMVFVANSAVLLGEELRGQDDSSTESSPSSGAPSSSESLNLPDIPIPESSLPRFDPRAFEVFQQVREGKIGLDEVNPIMGEVIGQMPSGSSAAHAKLMRELEERLEHRDARFAEDSGEHQPSRSVEIRAAEMLLKAARMLDKAAVGDENRTRLVNQMRREAVLLMLELRPDAADPGPSIGQSPSAVPRPALDRGPSDGTSGAPVDPLTADPGQADSPRTGS